MTSDRILEELGVYTSRAPRYTSYPTAAQFHNGITADFTEAALRNLDTAKPVSVYVHIPFCERLCWFCACRTQGTQTQKPVTAYLKGLAQEVTALKKLLPAGVRMGRMHWGGGTPTILQPDDIRFLARTIAGLFDLAQPFEFSVEIDPTLVDKEKITALSETGMNRASIGIQDFDAKVQKAIGRQQSLQQTRDCIADLRDAGIRSLNADILYGLPHQTLNSVDRTLTQVQKLDPDRIALYGYAHVPWMAKRQQMIDEAALPDGAARRQLFGQMADRLESSGYDPIGIDHFAKPEDTLAKAAATGHLRRNFQGYTTDRCETLIGLGASAISKFTEGYAQNAPRSSHYLRMVSGGSLATQRGVALTDDDRLRARAIEMVMCDFGVNTTELADNFGPIARNLEPSIEDIIKEYQGLVVRTESGFTIIDKKRALARLIARKFDAYSDETGKFSPVS
jgi:oxygen-independent coproporphyrinogen-3 oxidase